MIGFIKKIFNKDIENKNIESIKDNAEEKDNGLSVKNGGTGKRKDLFDAEAHKKVYEHFCKMQINKKETKCELCDCNKWSIGGLLIATLTYDGYSLDFAKDFIKIHPSVSLMCDNCGNTKFINAIKIGILESNVK